MRALALAAVFGAGLAVSGIAAAEPWTDPNGNLSFDAPRGWTVRPQAMQGGSAVLVFTGSSDCFFFGLPNPASAEASANAARNTTDQIESSAWVTILQPVADFASDGSPTVVSQSVDTSGFWPVQRAQLQWGERTIDGVLEVRPGFELRAFCSGDAASYRNLMNSLGHPNDAAWEAEVAAAEAAAVEAAAAAAAQPAPEEE